MPADTLSKKSFEDAKNTLIAHVKMGGREWRVLDVAIISMGNEAKKCGLPEDKVHQLIEILRDYIARPQAVKNDEATKLRAIAHVSDFVTTYKPPIPVAPIHKSSESKKTYSSTLEGAKEYLIDLVKKGEKDWGTLEGAVQKVISEAKTRGLPEEKTSKMLETLRNHIARSQSSKFSNETKLSEINGVYNDIVKHKTPGQPHHAAPTGTKPTLTDREMQAQLKALRDGVKPEKGTSHDDARSHGPK